MNNTITISGLNLLPQETYHDDAVIVGTTKGLTDLRDAITAALESGKSELQTFASDGEGYTLIMHHLTEDKFNSEATHYYRQGGA